MKKVTRRTWVGIASAAGAGVCLCGGMSSCATFTKVGNATPVPLDTYTLKEKRLTVLLDKIPELAAVGGSVKLMDPQLPTPLMLARTGDSEYHVVSLLCPHRHVEVEYQHKEKHFRCASLGHSTFNLDGSKIKGFSKQGLQSFATALDPADKTRLTIALG